MRKTHGLLIALLVLAVAACSKQAPAPPTTTSTTTTTQSPAEVAFVQAVRADPETMQSLWLLGDNKETSQTEPSDQEIVAGGRGACTLVRDGYPQYNRPPQDVLVNTWNILSEPPDPGARLIFLAVTNLCPGEQAVIDGIKGGTTTTTPEQRTFDVGTYTVPDQMLPGLYEARNPSECYWETRDANGDIVQNNYIVGSATARVTVKAPATSFSTRGSCGLWRKIG